MEQSVIPCAIIGAGPIGIEVAATLKNLGMKYVHLEAGGIASTIHWYSPGTVFFSSPDRISVAGVPLETPNQGKATREEYLGYLRGVVRQFKLPIQLYTRVTHICREPEGFRLSLHRSFHGVGGPREAAGEGSGQSLGSLTARSLVLAIGDMHRPNVLGIPGEDLPHVSHYFHDPHLYAGCRVLVVGGKNSAAEAVVRLYRVGAKVTLSHRQPSIPPEKIKYWLYPELRGLITGRQIEYLPSSRLIECRDKEAEFELFGDDGTTRKTICETDFVLLLTGYVQDPNLFWLAGVNTVGENRMPHFDPVTMETNVPGVYVAGTACGGTQGGGGHREFIETSHVHVDRIVAALQGRRIDFATPEFEQPES